MKIHIYNILLFAVLVMSSTSYSQVNVVKNFNYKYKTNLETKLIINNNYGNVNIINCKNDSIIVEVKIISKSKKKDKAIKRLAKVSIKEDVKANYISLTTELINNIKNNKVDIINIEYNVKLPIYANLYIANKYGDINITEHHGKLNVKLMYGVFNAKGIIFTDSQPLSKLNFEYSDVNINYCNWAEITSEYANIDIAESKTLVFNTSNSKIKLGKINLLKIKSEHDFFKINEVSKIYSNSEYTNFKIKAVLSDINVNGVYGNFKTEYISKYFENINIKFFYSNISLFFDKDASYKINCTVENGQIQKPKNANINVYKGEDYETVEGIVGRDKNTKKQVNVNSSYGILEF